MVPLTIWCRASLQLQMWPAGISRDQPAEDDPVASFDLSGRWKRHRADRRFHSHNFHISPNVILWKFDFVRMINNELSMWIKRIHLVISSRLIKKKSLLAL